MKSVAVHTLCRYGLSQQDAEDAWASLLYHMADALRSGFPVVLRGVGTISVGHRAEQEIRSVRTRRVLLVPAHKVLRFRPARSLRSALYPG